MIAKFDEIYQKCHELSLLSRERLLALSEAVDYVARNQIPGGIVECGVYKGGSALCMLLTLEEIGDISRPIYLYDTFTGMSKPTEKDVDFKGDPALPRWEKLQKEGYNEWAYASQEEVINNLSISNYPKRQVLLVQGEVEKTLPSLTPDWIALLHLDLDFYGPTYCAMCHLFPRLIKGGVLIMDDYGHWRGTKEAVDQYLVETKTTLSLAKVDYTGYVGIKK